MCKHPRSRQSMLWADWEAETLEGVSEGVGPEREVSDACSMDKVLNGSERTYLLFWSSSSSFKMATRSLSMSTREEKTQLFVNCCVGTHNDDHTTNGRRNFRKHQ